MILIISCIGFILLQGFTTYYTLDKSFLKKGVATFLVACLSFLVLAAFDTNLDLDYGEKEVFNLFFFLLLYPPFIWICMKIWGWIFNTSDNVSPQHTDVQESQPSNDALLLKRIRSLDKQAQQRIAQIQKERDEQLLVLHQELEQLQKELNSISNM